MCSILARWGSTTRRGRGANWKRRCRDASGRDGRAPGSLSWNAGGDSPAWGRKRQPFEASHTRVAGSVPYAELHCHSNYSFLDGASHPEELVDEAARLGLEALALTDHNGFYGIVRFAEAARAVGLPTVFGTELTLTPGLADTAARRPARARHRDPGRHRRAARHPSSRSARPAPRAARRRADRVRPPRPGAQPRSPGGGEGRAAVHARRRRRRHPRRGVGAHRVPQGRGADRRCSTTVRPPPAASSSGWSARFGRDRVLVELWDHGDPIDSARNDALVEIAHRVGVECIATNNVHYAAPAQRKLATAIAAVRVAPQPRRARSVAARRGRRPPALGCRAGTPLRPLSRRGRAGRRDRPGSGVRPLAGGAQPAAVPVPHGRRPCHDRDAVPAPPGRGRRPPSLRRASASARRGTRSTASSTSSSSSASPATSSSSGTSSSSAAATTSSAKAGGAPPTAPSATRSASPRSTPCRSACCSSASCRPSATDRPTSTSTSSPIAARR